MEVSGAVECGWWEEEKGWDIWVVSDWGGGDGMGWIGWMGCNVV